MNKWVDFSEDDYTILQEVAEELDEVYIEMRKGVAQHKYVFEVKVNSEYYEPSVGKYVVVPSHLVGIWMMSRAENLSYTRLNEAIRLYSWVRAKEVKVTTYSYEEE